MLADYRRGNSEDQAKAGFLERMLTVHGSDFEGDAGYSVDKTFLEVRRFLLPSVLARYIYSSCRVCLQPLCACVHPSLQPCTCSSCTRYARELGDFAPARAETRAGSCWVMPVLSVVRERQDELIVCPRRHAGTAG